MRKNNKALSLVIAMGLTLVMALLAIYILEYMIPFGKNTKNIEQSVSAYYQADSAVEQALYTVNSNTLGSENDVTMTTHSISKSIDVTAKGTNLPLSGQGNSEFNKDYNKIRIGEPIQIEIGDNSINPSNFKIFFKVPDLGPNTETLSGGTLKIINWQLSGENDVLNSSGSQITVSDIDGNDINISSRSGLNLSDSGATFGEFYSGGPNSNGVYSQCGGSNSGCILKMSVINKLELSDGTAVPYLEWKIDVDQSIPLRYTIIDTVGKSYGFQKNLRVKVPQQTLNEAFDFTVFQ